MLYFFFVFFFFQAEDGIRDLIVTGVQTCALPIFADRAIALPEDCDGGDAIARARQAMREEIGRASCRERVWISVVAVSLKKKKKQIKQYTNKNRQKNNNKQHQTTTQSIT